MTPMICQLPPAYRQAVTLADLEGVNQADAAARAGISLSGMKSRVHEADNSSKPSSRNAAGSSSIVAEPSSLMTRGSATPADRAEVATDAGASGGRRLGCQ